MRRFHGQVRGQPNHFPQASPDAVAFHRSPNLLGHRESDPGLTARTWAALDALHGEQSRMRLPARCGSEKIGSLLQPRCRQTGVWNGGSRRVADSGLELRPKGACVRVPDARLRLAGPQRWTYGRGSHAGACARSCWVERSVSRLLLRSTVRQAVSAVSLDFRLPVQCRADTKKHLTETFQSQEI